MKLGRGAIGALLATAATLSLLCVAGTELANASQSLTVQASLYPNRLNTSINLSATATFSAGAGPIPAPVTGLSFYAPAGLREDVSGTGTCAAIALEEMGTSGCPEDSRAGFGGGVAIYELGSEVVTEPFTIDVFLASAAPGHLALLAYVLGSAPASIERILTISQVRSPKPYGLGLKLAIPLISTLPGASYASIQSAFFTFGSANVAYYKAVDGRRRLVRLKGLLSPLRCPRGGFPLQTTAEFADGSTAVSKDTLPCPSTARHARR